MRSRTDYILGTYRCIFWNVTVRDPQHNSDHCLVLGCPRGTPLREHSENLGRRKEIPLWPPTTPTREDGLFAALRRAVPKPKARESQKKAWILAAMWRLVNKRVSARWDPARYQSLIWRLGRAINAILKGYQRRRTEVAGEEVNRLLGLDPPLQHEVWHRVHN